MALRLVQPPASLPVATEPLRNLLADSGYAVHFRHDLWTECFASHEKERWRGRGRDEDDALADVLRQMFPSSFARQLLAQHPLVARPARPALEAPAEVIAAIPEVVAVEAASDAPAPAAEPLATEAPAAEPPLTTETPEAEALVVEPVALADVPAIPLDVPASDARDLPTPSIAAPVSAPAARVTLIAAAARTDRGLVRERNEDACLAFAERGLVAVADGIGPHPGALIASTLVIETLRKAFEGDASLSPIRRKGLPLLLAAVDEANAAILDAGKRDRTVRGKGTTLAAVLVVGRQVALAHAGDSRIYRLRRDSLEVLTTDHALRNDRVRGASKASAQSAAASATRPRGEVTRAVGARRSVEVDTSVVTSQPGDVLLLCTAGLHSVVSPQEVADALAHNADPGIAADRLVALANAKGGPDNVTAAVIRW